MEVAFTKLSRHSNVVSLLWTIGYIEFRRRLEQIILFWNKSKEWKMIRINIGMGLLS